MITVVVADDHRIFRESLKALLDVHSEVAVIGEAWDGASTVRLASELRPASLLLDVEMPGQTVGETLTEIRAVSPHTRVIILTMHDSAPLAQNLLSRGASAFLVKTVGHEELVSILRAVVDRPLDIVSLSAGRAALVDAERDSGGALSPREAEILRMVAQAQSNRQIARHLSITEGTVKRHLSNINIKLATVSRLDAVRKAVARGFMERPYDL